MNTEYEKARDDVAENWSEMINFAPRESSEQAKISSIKVFKIGYAAATERLMGPLREAMEALEDNIHSMEYPGEESWLRESIKLSAAVVEKLKPFVEEGK